MTWHSRLRWAAIYLGHYAQGRIRLLLFVALLSIFAVLAYVAWPAMLPRHPQALAKARQACVQKEFARALRFLQRVEPFTRDIATEARQILWSVIHGASHDGDLDTAIAASRSLVPIAEDFWESHVLLLLLEEASVLQQAEEAMQQKKYRQAEQILSLPQAHDMAVFRTREERRRWLECVITLMQKE